MSGAIIVMSGAIIVMSGANQLSLNYEINCVTRVIMYNL